MAFVSRNRRCAICGSSEVTEIRTNGIFSCRTCGGECDHLMDSSDLERVMRVQIFGGSDEEITSLRRRYPHLGIATWSAANKLEIN